MQQLLDKWERLIKSEYLRPDEKLMLNHCISDLKRFMDDGVVEKSDKQQTAVEWLIQQLRKNENIRWRGTPFFELSEQAKEMEKEQSIELIKQTAMFMAASHLDKDIANMSYEDVYKTYYNETYGGNK